MTDEKSNVIGIRSKKPLDKHTLALYNFGVDLDKFFVDHLIQGIKRDEMSVVVAHRLGELIRVLPNKEEALDLAIDVLIRRAELNG